MESKTAGDLESMRPSSGKAGAPHDQPPLDRVTDYIRNHCAENLNLTDLACVAGISKYHFHRTFRETFGETLSEHIKRVRLEKSVGRLWAESNNSVTEVAYACGFSSSQDFARAFKAHFGLPPSEIRRGVELWRLNAKKTQHLDEGYGKKYRLPREIRPDGAFIRIPAWTENEHQEDSFQELEVVDMPSLRVASVRALAESPSDEFAAAMTRLVNWAVPRGLLIKDYLLLGAIEVRPDPARRFTYHACLTLPEGIDADEESGIAVSYLPAAEFGVYHGKFQSSPEIVRQWDRLSRGLWISSYFPRQGRYSYEIYYNNPDTHPSKTMLVDLCLPITTLRNK